MKRLALLPRKAEGHRILVEQTTGNESCLPPICKFLWIKQSSSHRSRKLIEHCSQIAAMAEMLKVERIYFN